MLDSITELETQAIDILSPVHMIDIGFLHRPRVLHEEYYLSEEDIIISAAS